MKRESGFLKIPLNRVFDATSTKQKKKSEAKTSDFFSYYYNSLNLIKAALEEHTSNKTNSFL